MQQPRLDGPTYASSSLLSLLLVSSRPFLPSLYQRPSHRLWLSLMLAMRIEHHSFQTKVCRRGSALFLHSSIPETPDSFSLLNHAFLREREGERSVEVYFFCFIFLLSFYYLLSCWKDIVRYSLLLRCFVLRRSLELRKRDCGRSETTELWNSKWKSVGQWSVTVEIGRVCN